jgi:hypothetical protein
LNTEGFKKNVYWAKHAECISSFSTNFHSNTSDKYFDSYGCMSAESHGALQVKRIGESSLDDCSAQVFPYNVFAYCFICRVDCKFARNKKKSVSGHRKATAKTGMRQQILQ